MTTNNHSAFTADVIRLAGVKGEVDSGPIYLCHAFPNDLAGLLAKVKAARGNSEDSVRQTIIEYWQATPEGDELMKDRAKLAAIKEKTATQAARFEEMQKRVNSVNTMLVRTLDTFDGIDTLKKSGRDVQIAKLHGTKVYVCFVKLSTEFESVRFSATLLQRIAGKVINSTTPTADVRSEVASLKTGAPNANKGANGERIAAPDLPKVVNNLDTSIAALIDDKTGKLAAGPKAREALRQLYARLHEMLSETERAEALQAFKADAAKDEAAKAKVEASVKQAATDATKRAKAASK